MPDWGYTMIGACLAAALLGYFAGFVWDEWKNR